MRSKRKRMFGGNPSVGGISGSNDGQWRREGHEWLGRKVRRFFKRGLIADGLVSKWMPEGADPKEDFALWHIEHSDGDTEDLEADEVKAALDAYGRMLERDPSLKPKKPPPPRRPPTEREQILDAMQTSAREVAPEDGVVPYRPFERADALLRECRMLAPKGDDGDSLLVSVSGLPRAGPFNRNTDEVSAERVVTLVDEAGGTLFKVDLADEAEGATVRLRIDGSGQADGSSSMEEGREAAAQKGEAAEVGEEETDFIYIYKDLEALLPPRDLPLPPAPSGLPSGPLPNAEPRRSYFTGSRLRRMADEYERLRPALENAWHEQAWRGFTNDPHRHDHKSTEFGWSTMPGGSEKQMAGRELGEAFRLTAWESREGARFYDEHVAPLLPAAWQALVSRYPRMCDQMLAAVPERYRLNGTAFTKVTLAINNPTPLHFDNKNFGVTFLICFDLDGGLVGGSHLICGMDLEAAVVVQDHGSGVVIVGDYRRVLHTNEATRAGRRFIMTAYCSASLVKLVADS
jgi:hypothetical protein